MSREQSPSDDDGPSGFFQDDGTRNSHDKGKGKQVKEQVGWADGLCEVHTYEIEPGHTLRRKVKSRRTKAVLLLPAPEPAPEPVPEPTPEPAPEPAPEPSTKPSPKTAPDAPAAQATPEHATFPEVESPPMPPFPPRSPRVDPFLRNPQEASPHQPLSVGNGPSFAPWIPRVDPFLIHLHEDTPYEPLGAGNGSSFAPWSPQVDPFLSTLPEVTPYQPLSPEMPSGQFPAPIQRPLPELTQLPGPTALPPSRHFRPAPRRSLLAPYALPPSGVPRLLRRIPPSKGSIADRYLSGRTPRKLRRKTPQPTSEPRIPSKRPPEDQWSRLVTQRRHPGRFGNVSGSPVSPGEKVPSSLKRKSRGESWDEEVMFLRDTKRRSAVGPGAIDQRHLSACNPNWVGLGLPLGKLAKPHNKKTPAPAGRAPTCSPLGFEMVPETFPGEDEPHAGGLFAGEPPSGLSRDLFETELGGQSTESPSTPQDRDKASDDNSSQGDHAPTPVEPDVPSQQPLAHIQGPLPPQGPTRRLRRVTAPGPLRDLRRGYKEDQARTRREPNTPPPRHRCGAPSPSPTLSHHRRARRDQPPQRSPRRSIRTDFARGVRKQYKRLKRAARFCADNPVVAMTMVFSAVALSVGVASSSDDDSWSLYSHDSDMRSWRR